MKLVKKQLTALLGGLPLGLLLAANPALAGSSLNMTQGITALSHEIYDLHMLILWICVVIAVLVFGAIFWSIIHFRKSKGAVAAQFHHSTTVEIIWTIIPMIILISMAIPATRVLVEMYDTSKADLTIKVTGYQWKWGYQYLDDGVAFFSTLARQDNYTRALDSGMAPADVPNYLLNVDNELVLPVGKKIRFLITADPNDVIHSWWMPALAIKTDAIPGYINEAWARIEPGKEGVYRGQCAELCGRDHGFMPVVIRVVSEQEFRQWVEKKKAEGFGVAPVAATEQQPAAAAAPAQAPAPQAAAAPAGKLSMDELMKQGQQVYTAHCVGCHQANGEGMPAAGFKPIKGSPVATGPVAAHLATVLKGKPGTAMASFASLSDQDIAAVVTYERNAFGNSTGDTVQAADVKAAR